ncbi:hypothetical protein M2133_001535, partial [Parabacteroides sp. PF5-6]|nr:hypothetical protein [Parabacteroides sp. PF5-6]
TSKLIRRFFARKKQKKSYRAHLAGVRGRRKKGEEGG